jgi:hypothetical protein
MSSLPEDVASALGVAEGTLTSVADSLAQHFADWGRESLLDRWRWGDHNRDRLS